MTFAKGCEMKEFIIDACKWYLYEEMDDSSKSEAIKNFKYRYGPLLGFLLESKLFKQKLPKTNDDWQVFELKLSDFTDEGLELVMCCHDRWLDSIQRGVSPENINLWKKQLTKLRRDLNESFH